MVYQNFTLGYVEKRCESVSPKVPMDLKRGLLWTILVELCGEKDFPDSCLKYIFEIPHFKGACKPRVHVITPVSLVISELPNDIRPIFLYSCGSPIRFSYIFIILCEGIFRPNLLVMVQCKCMTLNFCHFRQWVYSFIILNPFMALYSYDAYWSLLRAEVNRRLAV